MSFSESCASASVDHCFLSITTHSPRHHRHKHRHVGGKPLDEIKSNTRNHLLGHIPPRITAAPSEHSSVIATTIRHGSLLGAGASQVAMARTRPAGNSASEDSTSGRVTHRNQPYNAKQNRLMIPVLSGCASGSGRELQRDPESVCWPIRSSNKKTFTVLSWLPALWYNLEHPASQRDSFIATTNARGCFYSPASQRSLPTSSSCPPMWMHALSSKRLLHECSGNAKGLTLLHMMDLSGVKPGAKQAVAVLGFCDKDVCQPFGGILFKNRTLDVEPDLHLVFLTSIRIDAFGFY
eukprot:573565-Rhodomonas_salina.2